MWGREVDTWVTVACWVRGEVLGHVSANGVMRGGRDGPASGVNELGRMCHVLMPGILSFVLHVLVVFLQSISLSEL